MSALATTLPAHHTARIARGRVDEMLAQGWRLLDLPDDPEMPALMSGPVDDAGDGWRSIGDLIAGIGGANDA